MNYQLPKTDCPFPPYQDNQLKHSPCVQSTNIWKHAFIKCNIRLLYIHYYTIFSEAVDLCMLV